MTMMMMMMIAASMFDELVLEYISQHVLCVLVFIEKASTFIEVLVSTREDYSCLDDQVC